jgi:hypothetical protein
VPQGETDLAIADLAEQQLADDKIPTDALRFVDLGDNPLAVPDNLYPTEVCNTTASSERCPTPEAQQPRTSRSGRRCSVRPAQTEPPASRS